MKKLTNNNIPEILILDIELQEEKNGLFLLKKLKEKNIHEIFIIVFTSSKLEEEINDARELGCNVFLVKPIGGFHKLREIIEDYLNKKLIKGMKMKIILD